MSRHAHGLISTVIFHHHMFLGSNSGMNPGDVYLNCVSCFSTPPKVLISEHRSVLKKKNYLFFSEF